MPETYMLIRSELPHLKLPHWIDLLPTSRRKAKRLNREQLIAKRTYVLMASEFPKEQIQSENLWPRKLK
jgi:hypothetical protein